MQNNMIPLTVANTLDQTTKQRIEAKPNQTLKQAVQAQKLAPQGAFDVYDQLREGHFRQQRRQPSRRHRLCGRGQGGGGRIQGRLA